MHLYEVLRKPLITEKNSALQAQGKYFFEVDKSANKTLVKQAVQKAFDVTVMSVNIINVPGKTKRMGRNIVHTPSWKKAVVTLKEGETIQLFEGV